MRTSFTLVSVAALALSLAGCHKKPTDTTPVENAMVENVTDDAAADMNAAAPAATMGQDFADTAAKSDAFEIAEGKLATTMGKGKAVTDFAKMMVKGHTDSTAKLKAAAAAATPAITPDPMLKPDQQAKVDALGKLSGDAFDKQYAADQVAAHEEALAGLQAYSATGDVASLKTWATNTAPVVAGHLDMARKLPQ